MNAPDLDSDFPLSSDLLFNSDVDLSAYIKWPYRAMSQAEGDRPHYTQAVHQVESGQYGEALSTLNLAVVLHPHDHLAWTLRGAVLVYLNQYEAAIASCDRALMIQPHHSEAWRFRGLALHSLNRYREAYASYDHALGIVRRSPIESLIHWVRQRLNRTNDTPWQTLDGLLG